jgi:hypothetical protein
VCTFGIADRAWIRAKDPPTGCAAIRSQRFCMFLKWHNHCPSQYPIRKEAEVLSHQKGHNGFLPAVRTLRTLSRHAKSERLVLQVLFRRPKTRGSRLWVPIEKRDRFLTDARWCAYPKHTRGPIDYWLSKRTVCVHQQIS